VAPLDPSFDYEAGGANYASLRQPDARIARVIHGLLGTARRVLNVGAGAGSYEPQDRHVVALEPSQVMRAQRPRELVPALIGSAEAIPFDDGAFDAAMAVLTVHHWREHERSLRELRRVTAGPIVIVTFDLHAPTDFWLDRYAPEIFEVERSRFGTLDALRAALGGVTEVVPIAVPRDCSDGFQEAFYARPEAFLREEVRRAQSAWGFVGPDVERRAVAALEADLRSGAWDAEYGHLRSRAELMGQLRAVVARAR
jgi:SAM-dependent methyltransferase